MSSNNCSNGPIGFWFLNDYLNTKVIDGQLDEFVRQKFAGVVPHARDGLATPYLSQAWFDILSYIVDGCVKRGLEVWFYDENPFPSGTAGGRLLNKYPYLAGHTLAFNKISAKPVDGIINVSLDCTTTFLRVYAAKIDPVTGAQGRFEDVTNFAGMVGDRWHVEGERSKGYGPVFGDDSCEPFWRAWICHQSWSLYLPVEDDLERCILVVTLNKIAVDNSGWYIDALNPETATRFIEITHQSTLDKLGEKRFKQFTAVFTDEAKLCPPFPWTDSLPKDYYETYNEDIFKVLPDIAFNSDTNSELVRYKYRRLLGKLWLERFIKPMADWCQKYDLPLTGHISPEEDPIRQATMTPRWTSITGSMHWPGCDQITSKIGVPFSNAYLSLGPKLASSVAHQCGRKHVMGEALGISGENLNIQLMRKAIDWLILCGVDKFVLHGQFMTLDGQRKREAPPSIFNQSPYWEYMNQLSVYLERFAQWLEGGRPEKPIVVLYPTAAFEVSAEVANDYAIEKAQHLGDFIGNLALAGLDFDIVTDHDLCELKIENDNSGVRFRIGNAIYETLILPDIELFDEPTNSALARLEAGGIRIESLTEKIRLIGQKDRNSAPGTIHKDINSVIRLLVQRYRSWVKVDEHRAVMVMSLDKKGITERLLWNPDDICLPVIIKNSEYTRYITLDNSMPRSVRQLNSQEVVIEIEPLQTLILTNSSENGIKIVPQPSFFDANDAIWDENWSIMPHDLNVLNLSKWVIESAAENKNQVDLPAVSGKLPWGLDGQIVNFTSEIVIEQIFEDAELWWERSTFGGAYEININGRKVEGIKSASKYDVNDRYAAVGNLLKPGINRIEIQVGPVRSNEPAMLDPIRLCGLFKVIKTADNEQPAIISKAEKFTQINKPKDWTKLGYPHFSGMMSYFGTLKVKEHSGKVFLNAQKQIDPFEVFVNGKSAGVCCWSPFRVEITEYIEIGANKVEIRVRNTSMNRLEGKTQASGLMAQPRITKLPQNACKLYI